MNRRDIQVVKGDTYTHVVEFDSDVSSYTPVATLSNGATSISFAVAALSNETLELRLSPAQTANLDADATTQYKWRLTATEGGNVHTWLAGRAQVVDV